MKTQSSPGQTVETRKVKLKVDGVDRDFDIDDPKLPDWVDKHKLRSGGFPYDKKLDLETYVSTLERLQIELVKMVAWMQSTGERAIVLFEGRDAAGKGGTIEALRQYMNPRIAHNVALTKPTEVEKTQWYFQRYIAHFPSAGEFMTFDRSWYNRGGVEPVMRFCTPEQHRLFLEEAPRVEHSITRDGIRFFKFWLDIGHEMQLKRFHDRRQSLLTNWKFSDMDFAGLLKWDDYGKARDEMIVATHTDHAPWIIVRSNDKRRARLEVIRRILSSLPYAGRDDAAIGKADKKVVGAGPKFLVG